LKSTHVLFCAFNLQLETASGRRYFRLFLVNNNLLHFDHNLVNSLESNGTKLPKKTHFVRHQRVLLSQLNHAGIEFPGYNDAHIFVFVQNRKSYWGIVLPWDGLHAIKKLQKRGTPALN
jgi:hypothetical protein